MGIRIREILENEYFRNFRVIAGHGGLDRQFQGFAVLEAPDAFDWARGRELVFSSGYVLSKDKDLLKRLCKSENFQKMAGFALKLRYISEIDPESVEYFNRYNIPLIIIPNEVPWMELMNQVHVLVINRNIQRFRINAQAVNVSSDGTYPERKINSILRAVESEMGFPALLFDLSSHKAYYSSSRFTQDYPYPFRLEDFWAPSFSYSRHLMCPNLQMARYRFRDEDNTVNPPFSWITVPINVGTVTKAYFVILESRDLIDYYDEFAVRIAVLLLQAVYEQIMVTQSISNQSFESFIHYALQQATPDHTQLLLQANALNVRAQKKYYFALVEQKDPTVNFSAYREEIRNVQRKSLPAMEGHYAFVSENQCLFIAAAGEDDDCDLFHKEMLRFSTQLELEIPSGSFQYSFYDEKAPLIEVKRCLERCQRAMSLGPSLYPMEKIWRYRQMGAFAWLNIPQDEMDSMFREYLPILRNEKNTEDIRTLKVYLANNMNFSATAEKMYLHINTVRKRIDRALNLFPVDWNDSMSRMKIELMLQILQF